MYSLYFHSILQIQIPFNTTEKMTVYTDYIAATLMFNMQILPESLLSGILILGIILANQAILAMAAGGIGTHILTGVVGRLIMKWIPQTAVRTSSLDMCTNGFIGKSWARLLGSADLDASFMWHPNAPSVFMATIAYFVGYGGAIRTLYKEEISAGIMNSAMLTTTTVLSWLILAGAFVFRWASGCDSALGALAGIAVGLMIGYFGAIALGFITDRRGTNVWGIPILRDGILSKQGEGTVFVCDNT